MNSETEYFMGKHQDYWINLENENKQLKADLEMERKGFADALAAIKGEKK